MRFAIKLSCWQRWCLPSWLSIDRVVAENFSPFWQRTYSTVFFNFDNPKQVSSKALVNEPSCYSLQSKSAVKRHGEDERTMIPSLVLLSVVQCMMHPRVSVSTLDVSLVAACTVLRAPRRQSWQYEIKGVTIISISNKSLLPARSLKVNREREAYSSDYQLADIV